MNNLDKYNLIIWNSKKFNIYNDEFYFTTTTIFSNTNFLLDNYKRVDISNVLISNPITKLPILLQYLKLSDSYNFDIVLPFELLVLFFGKCFNKLINYPNKIFYIKYGDDFNCPVNNLPSSLEFLIFGKKFNQPIENLPNVLKLLYLSVEFNNSVDFLPNNLEYLNIGQNFNQSIDNLPISLVELTFYHDEKDFSTNVKYNYIYLIIKQILNLDDDYDKKIKQEKYTDHNYNLLPYKQYIFNKQINNLPINLEYLLLPDDYNIKISKLPKKIKYIQFGSKYTHDISNLSNYDKLTLVSVGKNIQFKIKELYKTKSLKLTIKIKNKTKLIKIKKNIWFNKIKYFF